MSKILSILKTTDQVSRFQDDIEKLKEDIFKTDNSFQDYLMGEMDADIAKIVGEDLANGDKKKILKEYESDLEKILPVKLIVAQQLSSKFIDALSVNIKSTIGEAAVLEIIVNKRILAGAVVEYDGRFCDSSLNTIFEKNKDKVVRVINGRI